MEPGRTGSKEKKARTFFEAGIWSPKSEGPAMTPPEASVRTSSRTFDRTIALKIEVTTQPDGLAAQYCTHLVCVVASKAPTNAAAGEVKLACLA